MAQEKKKNGEWDIKRYIDFSKYNRNIQEQATITDEARIAKKSEAAITDEARIAKKSEELIKNVRQILASMNTLESA